MALIRFILFLALFALGSAVRGNRRGDTVVHFDTYECGTAAPRVKIGAKCAVTVSIIARVAKSSESARGRNLWRVGVFGSERPDGSGERHDYVEQILTRKQASKPVEAGGALKLKNIRTRFNMGQIGCGPVAYFCVEFARSEQSSVDFELETEGRRGSIVTCERRNCSRTYAPAAVPTEGTQDKVRLTLGAPSWEFDIYQLCRDRRVGVQLKIYITPGADSESIVNGENLWQVGIYGSSDPAGRSGEKHGYVQNVVRHYGYYSPNILHGREFRLAGGWLFSLVGIGCEDTEFDYLCVEVEKSGLARPDFEIANIPNKRSMVSCRQMQCLTRETLRRYLIAADSLDSSVFSRYDVEWWLSALSVPNLDFDQFIARLSSSDI